MELPQTLMPTKFDTLRARPQQHSKGSIVDDGIGDYVLANSCFGKSSRATPIRLSAMP